DTLMPGDNGSSFLAAGASSGIPITPVAAAPAASLMNSLRRKVVNTLASLVSFRKLRIGIDSQGNALLSASKFACRGSPVTSLKYIFGRENAALRMDAEVSQNHPSHC